MTYAHHSDEKPVALSPQAMGIKPTVKTAKPQREIVSRWWYVRSDTHVVTENGEHLDIAQYSSDWDDPDAWKKCRGALTTRQDVADEKRELEAATYSKGRVRAVRVTRYHKGKA